MALANPVQIFPDMASWGAEYLHAALAVRSESYASGVTVTGHWPANKALPPRLVVVRDDGGARVGPVTKRCSLAVNVWAVSEFDCSDLALLVAALLEGAVGTGPVARHAGSTGPVRVRDESPTPHRYLTADLVVRGTDL